MTELANVITAARRELAAVRTKERELVAAGHYTPVGLNEAMQLSRKLALAKLDELSATYVQPQLAKPVTEAKPTLPDIAEHEAEALLQLFRSADTRERSRMIVEARSDAKLAAVLVDSHSRLTGIGDEARGMLREAHCPPSDIERRDAQLARQHEAQRAQKELTNIAQAIAGG